jgi:GNAT superfamily N-acetyltransferase
MPTTEALVVRPLTHQDREAWLTLWRGYLDFYGASVPDDVTALTWDRLNDPIESMFGLVAEHDGAVIGFAICVLHRSTWARQHYCYLEDLYVGEDVRGLGAGRALIEAVYARADELGAERVYWVTQETNATARVLYDAVAKRTGFVQYRRM